MRSIQGGPSGHRPWPARRWWRPARLAAVVAALVLVLAACGSDFDTADTASDEAATEAPSVEFDTSEESADDADGGSFDLSQADGAGEDLSADDAIAEPAAPDSAVAQEGEDNSLGAGGVSVTPTAADLGRKLIFTAVLNVEVEDVAASSAEATAIVEGLGGFLFGQNTVGGAQASSELIFKVRPDDFNRVLDQLGTVGELRNQSVTTDDVTERVVDLESRIQVADLGVARLRTALEGAATLEDYAELERLLLDRESDLEVMRGQLRTLQDRVDLATITMILTQDRVENAIEVTVSAYENHDGGASCPGQRDPRVEAGTDMTICFEVVNVGDQTLTQIAITDSVLEIDTDSTMIEVFGSLDELAPGQSVLVGHEFKVERSIRPRTRVVAIPTDGISSEQAGPSVSAPANLDIRTFEPDDDPGFGDGFSVAVSFLKALWIAFVVVLGFLIPLLILVPLLWLAWRGWTEFRRRRPPQTSTPPPSQGFTGGPPPPAPPPPAGVGATVPGPEAESGSEDPAPPGSDPATPS